MGNYKHRNIYTFYFSNNLKQCEYLRIVFIKERFFCVHKQSQNLQISYRMIIKIEQGLIGENITQ